MIFKGISILWIAILLIQLSAPKHQHRRYTGRLRNNNRSPSSSYTQNLKLLPGGTVKRTVYTGRYCAYPTTRLVPHRVKNGTQTYLRRIVSQCPWSSLYCNPQVRYVVSSRYSYKLKMKQVTRDEWRCCPGFYGSNCENVCFNCTTTSDLREKIEQLTQQISFVPRDENGQFTTNSSRTVDHLRGPEGPPGRMGLRGQRGYPGSVGPKGDVGAVGPRGFPGIKGSMGAKGIPGVDGIPGSNGATGPKGENGMQGLAGPAGIGGVKGEKGETGSVGEKGEMGRAGPSGLAGEPGGRGLIGLIGPEGPRGPTGPAGSPGPPGPSGVCRCSDGSAVVTDLPRAENNGSNACVHEGKTRRHQELWKPSICQECMCLEGSVRCSNISCLATTCQHTYKPLDFCCPVCCPSQEETREYMSGDGAEETLSDADDESLNETSPQPDTSEEIENSETESSNDHQIPSNVTGCPALSVTARSPLSSRASRNTACMLPKEVGPCRASIPKIYFDSTSMKCRPFTYSGCEGNDNNFDSPRECKRKCRVATSIQPRHDDARPRRPRRCNLPKVSGDCRANMPRFYYNRREGRCRLFTYGGCNGNENRFFTPWECRDVCGGSTPVFTAGRGKRKRRKQKKRIPRRCLLPKLKGPCRALSSRFYYNASTKLCQVFLYGGCGGNDNNFKLPMECEAVCGGKPHYQHEETSNIGSVVRARSSHSTIDTRCTQSLDSGPCKSGLYRYFFNSQTNKCSVFLYGGCRGNDNNFDTAEECRNTCGGDGFNFTITLESDFAGRKSSDSTGNGRRGKRGRPGPRGKPGPPGIGIQGPPGPPGPVGPSGTISPIAANEIRAIKATIESLKSRIVFLETQFLTDLVPAEDTEELNVPNVTSPSKRVDSSITTSSSNDATDPKRTPQGSLIGRGDAAIEHTSSHHYYSESDSD